jgi:dTDP-4-amino-4,6-dideoxygalactose transaminase
VRKGLIPRLKPYLGKEELLAALSRQKDAVNYFEKAFAETFEAKYALAFPYGRSGLWAFFKALGIEGAEVIIPAYTCSVVAHATVLSNNIPKFVDITLYDYNMDLDQVEAAISEKTRAIISTHLFGYPLDLDRLGRIVAAAEARWGQKIWVIQDCAHSFGARWQGRLVCNAGDMALFGLNVSKVITSVFGGMITTNDLELDRKLRRFRDQYFVKGTVLKNIRRFVYLLATYLAFYGRIYRLVSWLQEKTPMLDRLTKAYHLDQKIHFPPDFLDQMLELEARVGLTQLIRYPKIVRQQQENARYYTEKLRGISNLVLPPLVEGATYSHYVARATDHEQHLARARTAGVELGRVIQYSIPEMPAYQKYTDRDFPNARQAMHTVLNLPVRVSESDRWRVVEALLSIVG